MKSGRLLMPLLIFALGLAGCSSASRARSWAEQAVERNWQADYQVAFHQQDQDIIFSVQEVHADSLSLAIVGPEGLDLVLNYHEGFAVDLGQGQVQWQQKHQEPPYYSLWTLATVVAEAEIVESRNEWTQAGNYQLQLSQGRPVIVKFLDLWTLELEEFVWD